MIRTPESVALTLVTGLAREGGATTSATANVDVPSTGYAVSIPAAGRVLLIDALQPYDVADWVSRHRDLLAEPGKYAGIWLDRETGEVYLDVNEVFADSTDAALAAVAAGQVAVFDLAEHREHRTSDLLEVS
jgi:hypothetical protein